MSLEYALAVPALFLLVLLVLHAAVLGRDVLLVQSAAREGARVAATTTSDAAVRSAVQRALDGRHATVRVAPRARTAGDLVRVEVALRSRAGRGTVVLRGHAATVVEPSVDG